ncbi:TetR-like C-terminal domain-containing protein [Actinomadura vinacea]|uniref:TetR-like C-terminal domain-containing protein n=1 Tax=Actinomadura vinacea TaxID=115336 RepID=UPI0031E48E59
MAAPPACRPGCAGRTARRVTRRGPTSTRCGYGLEGSAAVHATRRLRVLVHGFASIGSAGGFGLPEDLDDTYDQLIQMYLSNLRNKS